MMKERIKQLLNQLNHGLVEREDAIKAALLTMLAGENLVLIGPPGTGKSLVARRVAESLTNSSDTSAYFEYLLTKFSTPEEIFGPLSIKELKNDRFKRNTVGYLPTVKVAFLDEIFKASSSILNALLTILNERIYHNGAEPQRVPMQALIAASNELPTDQEELSALYDRFLVRIFVDYVSQDSLPRLFARAEAMPELTKISATDLQNIQHATESIIIPPDVEEAMVRIWVQHKETFKEDRRESLSDRRLKKVINLLCVSAATNGRDEVDFSDVFLLKDCLWNHQDNAIKVRDMIKHTLRSYSQTVPQDGAKVNAPSDPSPVGKKANVLIKGYKGSGSAQDPLLVENFHDLMGLERPEVGLQGYSFLQTADIDCTELSSWASIVFKGCYDGGGHAIKYKKIQNNGVELFSSIQAQSNIANLKLEDLGLAVIVDDSQINHCQSNGVLITISAINSTITACQTGDSLIGEKATNCTISACKSASFLIGKSASGSTIMDCLVAISVDLTGHEGIVGGITSTLTKGSIVERCFIMGKLIYLDKKMGLVLGFGSIYFSGIANTCNSSSIRQCALGNIKFINSTGYKLNWRSRITYEIENRKASELENNVSIDSNNITGNDSENDGKTVASALFTKQYFENNLGWDFENVWQWDSGNEMPELRSVSLGAASQQKNPVYTEANMADLLTQQMRSNIWL